MVILVIRREGGSKMSRPFDLDFLQEMSELGSAGRHGNEREIGRW
jgi:hypothetical protein